MKIRSLIITAIAAVIISFSAAGRTRVACVGNSITYGTGLPDDLRQSRCYPAVLQQMLGSDYEVGNFGRPGATLLRRGHRPYFEQPEFGAAIAMKPDIAVIHLGVNDTDPRDWPNFGDFFITDYAALIDSLRASNPEVRIIIARLTPIGAKHPRFTTGTRDWRLLEQQAIENVARLKGVELIDFDRPLRDRQNLMPDAIHPDAEGYGLLALTVYSAITGNYGGLRLPAYYQDGMVLQRHRPLTIAGTADAHRPVSVKLDGVTYRTESDNQGRWSVLTAPLCDGTTYTLTVSSEERTIELRDILAGEVWLASGQSNMEFPLHNTVTAQSDIAAARHDPLLRFYDMRPIARTDNVTWPDSILAAIDTLGHFAPARWQEADPSNIGPISAVAYYFARNLRDSLGVPVGVISNAVGGAPCEAWIDVNSLEERVPGILVDWRHNDYMQPWAQGRADKNAPAPHRHPYEPSYLFSSGIRPLGSPDIAGVIWYQGESNAHNTELHERLFPTLVDSWRKEFRRRDLPVCFVQLSSIDRASWPTFRDSQRRMAQELDNVYMAVSCDRGDSLDVHPRDKRPIGRRLALQALHNVYGRADIAASSPNPIAARADREGNVAIDFDRTLATSDGKAPTTFEVADATMLFRPAKATILPEGKVLLERAVDRPRYVRYAWQPFTRANLISSTDSLPASTFKIAIDNMDELYEIESGYERGVSAAFAGRMPSGRIVVAGGCNFPCDDPLAPGASKRFYRGIYAVDPSTTALTRIGNLPRAIAYGATVSLPEGIAIIGGTTDQGSTAECLLVTDNLTTTALPSLPEPLDNMAAATVGRTIYVAGGSLAGAPSNEIFALDLDRLDRGWRKLRSMPGNPRVQPVMAASGSKLYIFGGFAGRHDGDEPTLELGGLVYDTATRRWSETAGPVTPDGESIATGGGAAATLSDGRIAIAGGVNKDIFLAALIDQAPDYLLHPIGWYKFNARILVFDPATGRWTVSEPDAMNARAGASLIAGDDSDFYLFGGELKPRIRTNQTIHKKVNR